MPFDPLLAVSLLGMAVTFGAGLLLGSALRLDHAARMYRELAAPKPQAGK